MSALRSRGGPCFRRDDVSKNLRYNRGDMIASMQGLFTFLIRTTALAALLCTALPHRLSATGTELTDPQIDPGACLAAASAGDADNIITVCGALAENEKTARADRV